MWPLCVISEKLFRMAGDDGAQGAAGSPYPDGRISLARRSYYVDVSLHSVAQLLLSHCASLDFLRTMRFPHYLHLFA